MIRSALLALDTSLASETALEMAIALCKRYGDNLEGKQKPLHLSGVAVVDVAGIKAPTSVPLGAGAFKKQRDETLLQNAQEKTEQVLQHFEERCKAAGIPHTAIRSEGMPYEQIELAARSHDIILIGRDTNFHYETSETVGATVKQLLVDSARPVIVYPQQLPDNHRVVVAYDGSVTSAHALHLWTLLEIRSPLTEIHLVSVSDQQAKADARLAEAARLLEFHDCQATLHYIPKVKPVGDCLSEFVNDIKPRMVVLGAYGRGGLKEALFGSATNRMLDQCNCPLFLSK